LASAAQKAGRLTTEGVVASYIHAGGKIGVLIEVNCETDFVARNEEFQQLVHDLAMQICATDPRFIRREDVTPEILEQEKEVLYAQAAASGKPEAVLERIVEGRLGKFFEDTCLYEQHFIKDPTGNVKVGELIASKIAKFGENITVRRFSRFKVAEGLTKPPAEPAPAQ
jgi:elongation factor Ts